MRDLTGGSLTELDFDLHSGEVLGLTGLVGSGFEEIPYLLFGAWRPQSGRLRARRQRPRPDEDDAGRAIELGMALIPADRQKDGAVGSLPISTTSACGASAPLAQGQAPPAPDVPSVPEPMTRYDVRPNDPRLNYGPLSGGNQQKALIAKWMQTEPSLLLLHEPTQGVDVGARQQIFSMIREATAKGMAVVCASSDYEQLATICDRVLLRRRSHRQPADGAERDQGANHRAVLQQHVPRRGKGCDL